MPVESAQASMVVDIGGGTTEVAIISLNGIVHAQSALVGGDRFDEAIINYVRRNYNCLIGETTAERIKKTIGQAYPSQEIREMQISGRHVIEGVPRSIVINSNDVLEALQDSLNTMIESIRFALEQSPPELAADIEEKGIVLTGGGALLAGLDRLISEETRLPVYVAQDPLTCVARGGGEVLEKLSIETLEFLSQE
jgi:rod shape-determining protein MreB